MAAESETSALSVTLHPLVIINVSDHFTRSRCNTSGSTDTRVFGILIGVQNGRQMEIANSFEVKVVPEGARPVRRPAVPRALHFVRTALSMPDRTRAQPPTL